MNIKKKNIFKGTVHRNLIIGQVRNNLAEVEKGRGGGGASAPGAKINVGDQDEMVRRKLKIRRHHSTYIRWQLRTGYVRMI